MAFEDVLLMANSIPRQEYPAEYDAPCICEVCEKPVGNLQSSPNECQCPECPECGVTGRPECFSSNQ